MHKHATWFALDENNNEMNLTQLYNWYGDDFVQIEGSVEKFAATQSSDLKQHLESGHRPTVRWVEYDWTLNDKRNKTTR